MIFVKRFAFYLGIGFLALVLLLIVASSFCVAWLQWAGDRDWKRVQAELRAKGEKLTFQELLPPSPPESENFFADPLWEDFTDPTIDKEQRRINQWETPLTIQESDQIKSLLPGKHVSKNRSNAIKLLGKSLRKTQVPEQEAKIARLLTELIEPAQPVLSKIAELARRPSAFFPLQYQSGVGMPIPHVIELLSIGQILGAKIGAEMELGNRENAFTDTLTFLRLSAVLKDEPVLIAFLARVSLIEMALESVDHGIEHHQWNDMELSEFQQELTGIQLRKDLIFSMRGERALMMISLQNSAPNHDFQKYRSFLLVYMIASYESLAQDTLERLDNALDQPWNISNPDFTEIKSLEKANFLVKGLNILASLILENTDSGVERTIEAQTHVSQTLITCALERYRLAHGCYPGSLDALIPEYLTSIPKEPTTGNPMHYQTQSDGTFLLWAPGWKLQTLNGKPGEFHGEGDIVWNLPIPMNPRN